MKLHRLCLVTAALFLCAAVRAQVPVGTEFTYQGELRNNGALVTSSADLRFRLYDAATGGNQQGFELQLLNASLDSGRFTVGLDFGTSAFGPFARWIEVSVRAPAGTGFYTTLTPRQRLHITPVAGFALSGNPGPTGPMGVQGAQGSPGPQGPTGSTGATGSPGSPGSAGPTGAPGSPGATGLAGATGATGATGDPGLLWRGSWTPALVYAIGDSVIHDGSSYRSLLAQNTGNPPTTSPAHWEPLALRGVDGATGATGAAGPTGIAGAVGATGAQGPPGVQGAIGPTGPVGAQGPIGPTGLSGETGPTGAIGPVGPTGPAGTSSMATPFVVGTDPTDPYSTVQSAVTAAEAAGGSRLVFIKPGLYTGNVTISSPSLTLEGAGARATVLEGTFTISPSQGTTRDVCKVSAITMRVSVSNGLTVTSPSPLSVELVDVVVECPASTTPSVFFGSPAGGRIQLVRPTIQGRVSVQGSSLVVDMRDGFLDGITCSSSHLLLSGCTMSSSTGACIDLNGGTCIASSCRMTTFAVLPGSPEPDCIQCTNQGAVVCRSCTTVGRLVCDGASMRLEECDDSDTDSECVFVTNGGTCSATACRLRGDMSGAGAGGRVALHISTSSTFSGSGTLCVGQVSCTSSSLQLQSCSFIDDDDDDDGVVDLRSGSSCVMTSCLVDSRGPSGARVSVLCDGSSSTCDIRGSVCYGQLQCSSSSSTRVLSSYFETGDKPTQRVTGGSSLTMSSSSSVCSPGALTNSVCLQISDLNSDGRVDCCSFSGAVSVSSSATLSLHSSSCRTLDQPCLRVTDADGDGARCTFTCGSSTSSDSRCVSVSGPSSSLSLSHSLLVGGEECDDGSTLDNDSCSIRCVSSPCVTVSSTSHATLHSSSMLTSASPAVSSPPGGDVRFGVVTYTGGGGGMPPQAVALPVENVAQLVTLQVQSFSGPVSMTNPNNSFSGSGSGLTSLSASSLTTGTVPDARLSSSVVRTNAPNIFTLEQTFTQALRAMGGVQFPDGTIQTKAASPPLSSYVVSQDPADPFSSIQAAVSAAESAGGGVVIVKSGTFTGDVTITRPNIVVTSVSGNDGRSYVSGKFMLALDGGGTSGRIVLQGLDISSTTGPALSVTGQHFTEVLVSSCRMSSAGTTCVLVDCPGLDAQGRPSSVRMVDGSASSSASPGTTMVVSAGRAFLTGYSLTPLDGDVDGVALMVNSSAGEQCDDCTFHGRVAFASPGSCGMTRCSITLPPSPVLSRVAFALSGQCVCSMRDCVVSGGRVDSSGSSRLTMTGGQILVAGGEDAVRVTVTARDQYDNVRMNGRVVCSDGCECVMSACRVTVATGAAVTGDGTSRITWNECFLTGRVDLSGDCQCSATCGSLSVTTGSCMTLSGQCSLAVADLDLDGRVDLVTAGRVTMTSSRLHAATGDCLSIDDDCDDYSFTSLDCQSPVSAAGSGSFTDCTFRAPVASKGTKQKAWLCSNFRFAGGACMTVSEDCDDTMDACTFMGSVSNGGGTRGVITGCTFHGPVSLSGDCDDAMDACTFLSTVSNAGTSRGRFTGCDFQGAISLTEECDDSYSSCTFRSSVDCGGNSNWLFQGSSFLSAIDSLDTDDDCDGIAMDCTFAGPVECAGQSSAFRSCIFRSTGVCLSIIGDGVDQDCDGIDCTFDGTVSASGTASCSFSSCEFTRTTGVALAVSGSCTCACSHLRFQATATFSDGSSADLTSCEFRCPNGSCVTMSETSSVTLMHSVLESPPGTSVVIAPSSATLRVAQVVLPGQSLVSGLPSHTVQVVVSDPIDSSRIVDGSVSSLDIASSSISSSHLAMDSSSLVRVSGGSLLASASSVTLSDGVSLAFGTIDSPTLFRDGLRLSTSSALTVSGNLDVTSGLLSSPGGASFGGGGGGGSGGQVTVTSTGDIEVDGALTASGVLFTSSSSPRVGIGTSTPPATLSVLASGTDRAAVFSSSSLVQSALFVDVSSPSSQAAAIEGRAHADNNRAIGVLGRNDSPVGQGVGVQGESASPQGFGLFALGNSGASGVKSFHIDHPLDPANKFLRHYSAEGPDALNIYRGTISLDDRGEATVRLPDYFEAINRDFHYQLTCIGGFAPVYIADEIRDNTFRIAGGVRGLKVSWTVTGIRNDPFVRAAPPLVEILKPTEFRDRYLHPALFGQPSDKAIHLNEPAPPAAPGDPVAAKR
jgi:pectin methylesterase-like acyl-CoA thioesterase